MTMIPILADPGPSDNTTRGAEPTLGTDALRSRSFSSSPVLGGHREVDVDIVKSGLNHLTGAIGELLTDLKAVGAYKLKQVSVTVEINAEGKVFLVGKAGAKGGVTLTFEA